MATQLRTPYIFNPIDENAQRFLCSLVDLPLIFPHARKISKPLNKPIKLYNIIGDGNCLFRALSYIITGRQIYHMTVRHKILEHMRSIENLLLPHMNMSLNNYFLASGMANETVWGTDTEIFAASSLLSTDIYVYTNTGSNMSWNKFSQSMLDNSSPQNTCAIYIQHTSGVHYDVVLDVELCSSETPHNLGKNPNQKRNLQNPRAIYIQHTSGVHYDVLDVDSCTSETPPNSGTKQKRKHLSNKNSFVIKNIPNKVSKLDKVFQSNLSHEPNSMNNKCKVKASIPCQISKKNEKHTMDNTLSQNYKSNIDQFHKTMNLYLNHCSKCHEAWPLTTKPKSNGTYVCRKCSTDKQIPLKFSFENNMIPSHVPHELQSLTQIEEMLIARALPIMRVYVKPGGQRGYSGHCINLPQRVSELAQSLPRCPSTVPVIVVTMKEKGNVMKDVTVRNQKVEQALQWLINHNPHYNVSIDSRVLNALPSNGVPLNIQTIETVDDPDAIDSDDLDPIATEDEVYNCETQTHSFLPQSKNDILESDAIKNSITGNKIDWPTIEDQPFNEYTTPFLATLAFPTLFPDGKGDPTNPCLQRDVPFCKGIQHLIKYAENINGNMVYRFASHPRFSYWALNMIQRKRALQQNSIFLKQNPDESHLTMEELRKMANNNSSSCFMSKISRYVANITGSSAYWFKIRQDLKAIIAAKGAPTIFFTFSSADLHWPELHSIFSPDVAKLSVNNKRENVIDNPHIVDWFFTKRLE